MRLLLLSDIHGNLTALKAVLTDLQNRNYQVDVLCSLGDMVNYGPRPNEIIEQLKNIDIPILVSLWGNHEYSVFGGDPTRFATDRGRTVLKYTQKVLTNESVKYLKEKLENCGYKECEIDGSRFLFVHGKLSDPYWGKLDIQEMTKAEYQKYDYVISGHTHVPQYVEYFNKADNPEYRNKKRTIFINPGSVGQPRNHNPYAQYGILDTNTGEYCHLCVVYDIEAEQILYPEEEDVFYKNRIKLGI